MLQIPQPGITRRDIRAEHTNIDTLVISEGEVLYYMKIGSEHRRKLNPEHNINIQMLVVVSNHLERPDWINEKVE